MQRGIYFEINVRHLEFSNDQLGQFDKTHQFNMSLYHNLHYSLLFIKYEGKTCEFKSISDVIMTI